VAVWMRSRKSSASAIAALANLLGNFISLGNCGFQAIYGSKNKKGVQISLDALLTQQPTTEKTLNRLSGIPLSAKDI
jgi:hypothetical protein